MFLAVALADINDGAGGDAVLEVTFPDDINLSAHAIVEDGRPQLEWCVPADLINLNTTVRLLTEDEVDEARFGRHV